LLVEKCRFFDLKQQVSGALYVTKASQFNFFLRGKMQVEEWSSLSAWMLED